MYSGINIIWSAVLSAFAHKKTVWNKKIKSQSKRRISAPNVFFGVS